MTTVYSQDYVFRLYGVKDKLLPLALLGLEREKFRAGGGVRGSVCPAQAKIALLLNGMEDGIVLVLVSPSICLGKIDHKN